MNNHVTMYVIVKLCFPKIEISWKRNVHILNGMGKLIRGL